MVDTGETFLEIAMKHAIEEVFSFVSEVVDHGYSIFAMLDLLGSVASETNSLYPSDLREPLCYSGCYESRIHGLIEVYFVASLNYLFDLMDAVV